MIKKNLKILFIILITLFLLFIYTFFIPTKFYGFNKECIYIKHYSPNWHDTAKILKNNPSLKLCVGGHGGWLENDNVIKMDTIKEDGIKNFKILNENEAEIIVDARTTSETLYNWLLEKNYFIGGQPDPVNISIGGILSIGGVGISSISNGLFAENVIELYGIKKGGTEIEKQNPYDFMCNLGENGIITDVKFRCEKIEDMEWDRYMVNIIDLNEQFYKTMINNKVKYFNQIIKDDICSIIIGKIGNRKDNTKYYNNNLYNGIFKWIRNNNKKKPLWVSWIFPNCKLYLEFLDIVDNIFINLNIEITWHLIILNNSNKTRPPHFPLTNTEYSYGLGIYIYTDIIKWAKIKNNILQDINKIAVDLMGKPYLINVKI